MKSVSLVVTGAEEGPELEFKGAGALKASDKEKTEISKDVSSFANSAGGAIIYGMDEDPNPPHKATRVSPIDPQQFSKEWLEQVIHSRIHPRIQGLVIKPVDITKGQPPGVSYVVIVPQSFTAHQAHDKKYYKRYNFESVPMDDYEIRQIMNRKQRPTYDLLLEQRPQTVDNQKCFRFTGVVQNSSEITGHEVSAILFVPEDLVIGPHKAAFGPVELDQIPYIGIAGNFTGTLSPLNKQTVGFDRFYMREPTPFEGMRVCLYVHVYDEHGQALENRLEISCPEGIIRLIETRKRERIHY